MQRLWANVGFVNKVEWHWHRTKSCTLVLYKTEIYADGYFDANIVQIKEMIPVEVCKTGITVKRGQAFRKEKGRKPITKSEGKVICVSEIPVHFIIFSSQREVSNSNLNIV